jgi:hypothetical protein
MTFEEALAQAEDIIREAGFPLPIAWVCSFMWDNHMEVLARFNGSELQDDLARMIDEISEFESEFNDA